ncbi:MAG TPA: phosphate acyltransferase PlsX, partial [Alphaproteobacteria bacterium]
MSGTIRIALDAMGGDFGPESVIPAAALASASRRNLRFSIFGDAAKIQSYLNAHPDLKNISDVTHTDVFVDNHEKPTTALRKKGSSLRMAIDAVQSGQADCIVSAGNTGALMATAKLVFKTLPGIHRPAIACIMPNMQGTRTIMLDVGANVQADAENLVQFAVLGSCFSRSVCGVEKPLVGILNIGSEDTKGHETLHQASAILTQAKFPGRYKGFVEGTDINNGSVDVVVTDGFTGNVSLKTAEGVGKFISSVIKREFTSSLLAKLGMVFAYGALKKAKKRMDPREYNGALFLGLNNI